MSDLLDAKSFRKMQEAYRNTQELREETIKLSRDIQKESKQAIYAIHRKDLASSREKIGKAEKTIGQIRKLICDTPALESVGSYSESLEEYVEASALLAFMENRGIPTPEKLGVGNEIYLQGLCDLSGELVRVAVNEIIAENYNSVTKIRKFTAEMYEYMLGFDFRNTLLRKKFDSIKYNLEKMEDLILDLKVRDKIKGLSL